MLFKDLVQKALKEGMLQFGKKPKASMHVDVNMLQIEDARYTKPVEILMVENTEGFEMEIEKGEQISILLIQSCRRPTLKVMRV